MKMRSVGAELFHTEDKGTYGQTNMTKLIVALCNFKNASKNYSFLSPS